MLFYHWTKRTSTIIILGFFIFFFLTAFSYFLITSNQIRTDDIYLEGRGYTNLTILVFFEPFQIRTGTPLIDN